MKVNYLPKNRSRRLYLKPILALLAIFISGAIAFSFLGAAVITVASPVWKAENAVMRSFGNLVSFFASREALVAENNMLKEKLSALETEIPARAAWQTQESALLELLGRKGKTAVITAAVLTHPPQTPYDVIVIDAGANESVVVGAKVALPEGPMLGVVSEVFSKSAKVKLFSANGEETNAVLERNNVPVTLVGLGGGNFKLAVPRDLAIEKGDRILSTDMVPRLLAVVGDISVQPTDSFKEVLAKSPTNIFSLKFVFVTP